MWPNSQFSADLVVFTKEILNGKLHFLQRDIHCVKNASIWVSVTCICPYNGRIVDVLTREKTDQRKPVYWYILRSDALLTLREKWLYLEFFWSKIRSLSLFRPNVGKHEPENFRIRTPFTQCSLHKIN